MLIPDGATSPPALPRVGRTALPRWCVPALQAAATLVMASDLGSGERTGGLIVPLLLSLGVSADAAEIVHGMLRALGHVTAYAVFAALVRWSLAGRKGRGRTALLLALVLAVLDESVQSFVASRSGDPLDVLLDVGGAALGLHVAARLGRRGRTSPEGEGPGPATPAAAPVTAPSEPAP